MNVKGLSFEEVVKQKRSLEDMEIELQNYTLSLR